MKLIDERGRLFGRFNIVDMLVLLAILIVVAAAAWYLVGNKIAEASMPDVKMTMVTRIRGAHPRQYEEIAKNKLPQQLISGNNYVDDAYLVKVEKTPYVVQLQTDDGQIKEATDPTRIDVLFTIEARVPADQPITKIGTQEIRAGRDHIIKTKYIEYASIIEKVTYEPLSDKK